MVLLVAGAAAIGPWSLHHASDSTTARPVSIGQLQPQDLARIHDDIRRMQTAVFEGDCETVMGLAHPRWVAAIGGRDVMRREIKALAPVQHRAGPKIEFTEVAFRDTATALGSPTTVFVIVPSMCVFTRGKERIEVPTFDLAVRQRGRSEWRYVGGTELDEQQARVLFADLPADLRFPPKATKILER